MEHLEIGQMSELIFIDHYQATSFRFQGISQLVPIVDLSCQFILSGHFKMLSSTPLSLDISSSLLL